MGKMLSKILEIVSIMFLIAGIILVILGRANGGKFSFIIDYKQHRVRPISDVAISDNLELGEFDSIKIDANLGNIKIIPSDRYAVEYNLYNDHEPDITVSDGRLVIDANGYSNNSGISINGNGVVFDPVGIFRNLSAKDYYINVYVPEDIVLKEINIENNLGNFEIKDITVENLVTKLDVGNVELSKIKLINADVNVDVGNIDLVVVKENTGDEYSLNLEVEVGDIDSGLDIGSKNKVEKKVDNAYGSIKARCDIGDIDLKFE